MHDRAATLYIGALLLFALFSGIACWYRYVYLGDFPYVVADSVEALLGTGEEEL